MLYDLKVVKGPEKEDELAFLQIEPDGTSLFFDLIELNWLMGMLPYIELEETVVTKTQIFAERTCLHNDDLVFNFMPKEPLQRYFKDATKIQADDFKEGDHLRIYNSLYFDKEKLENEWNQATKGKYNSAREFIEEQYKHSHPDTVITNSQVLRFAEPATQ